MKKLLIVSLIGLVLGFGTLVLADKKDIICACGCQQPAVDCGCPVALEQLKDLKDA